MADFELFDPKGDVRITAGNLPHWYQPGVTYFVTFRTEDSLPAAVSDLWHRRRRDWLLRHGIDPKQPSWQRQLQRLPPPERRQYHAEFSEEYLALLDKGYGECVLKEPALAAEVGKSLHHFDGQRYHLGDFVVMGNHVHLLVCLLGETDIEEQCYSWKKFTAAAINRRLGRKGRFWQEESFDHLVRSADEFDYIRVYIQENPAKANLGDGQFLYYRRADLRSTPHGVRLSP
jgi:REP element-mobilizing transposase RayT